MARRPYEPEPWLREAIAASFAHDLEMLALASERFGEHHGADPERTQKLAREYRAQADEFRTWALGPERPPIVLTSLSLWAALYRAKAPDELTDQVATLGREHTEPGAPCHFRLDEHDQLHLETTPGPHQETTP